MATAPIGREQDRKRLFSTQTEGEPVISNCVGYFPFRESVSNVIPTIPVLYRSLY